MLLLLLSACSSNDGTEDVKAFAGSWTYDAATLASDCVRVPPTPTGTTIFTLVDVRHITTNQLAQLASVTPVTQCDPLFSYSPDGMLYFVTSDLRCDVTQADGTQAELTWFVYELDPSVAQTTLSFSSMFSLVSATGTCTTSATGTLVR
ncbi:MAG: hypothetical protein ABI321_19405 [Polyangia bacterium]